jgi:hypothetical protein
MFGKGMNHLISKLTRAAERVCPCFIALGNLTIALSQDDPEYGRVFTVNEIA